MPSHLRPRVQISRSFRVHFYSHSCGQEYCLILVHLIPLLLGLEVETLEEPLHVSSPLEARVSIDKICRGCELEISRILLTMDVIVMDMSEFDVIFGIDWLMTH